MAIALAGACVCGHQADAGGDEVGLHSPIEDEAAGGEGSNPSRPGVRQSPDRAELDRQRFACGQRLQGGATRPRGECDHRNRGRYVEIEPARGHSSPRDEERGRSRRRGVSCLGGDVATGRQEDGAAGHGAEAVPVEEIS